MKFKLLILAVMVAFSTSAQDCHVEKDAFTGARTVTYSYKNESLIYQMIDEKPALYIKFNYQGEFNSSVPAGTQLLLKTESDEIVKLTTTKDAFPVSTVSGYSIISAYTYSFDLTKKTLQSITGSKLVLMRYPNAKGGSTDLPFKGAGKKWGRALTNGANCMLENMK